MDTISTEPIASPDTGDLTAPVSGELGVISKMVFCQLNRKLKTCFGFLMVLAGVVLTIIELGTLASEQHLLSYPSNKLLFALFCTIGIGLIYFGSRLMKRKGT